LIHVPHSFHEFVIPALAGIHRRPEKISGSPTDAIENDGIF
jgi:hypothetical protein